MELSQTEVELVAGWLAYAENDGASSTVTGDGRALRLRIQEALKPEPRVTVELTISELDMISFWYGSSDDVPDDDVQKETELFKRLLTARGLAV